MVVSDVSPLLRVDGLVYARVGHVYPDALPEGAGDGVRGVDPAVRVQHVLKEDPTFIDELTVSE